MRDFVRYTHYHMTIIFIMNGAMIYMFDKFFYILTGYESGDSSRMRQGSFAAIVGICANLVLFALKLSLGLISGSISIIADALNNLSDTGTSVVLLLGFRIAAKPADEEHPFGHGRAEYLSGLLVSVAILFMGMQIFFSSVQALLNPVNMAVNGAVIGALCLSILAKFLLALFFRREGEKIGSYSIKAAEADSLSDCAATGGALVASAVYLLWGMNIDGAAGIFVSGFVLFNGWNTMKNAIQPLLGNAPSQKLIGEIRRLIMDEPKVLGVHDLIMHDYGPGRSFLSAHVEIPSTMDVVDAHEVADRIERQLFAKFRISAILHIDPVSVDNPESDSLLVLSLRLLSSVDERLSLHDFRVVPYKQGRKLIFDVTVPQSFHMDDRQIRREFLKRLVTLHPKDRALIHMDHQYT